MSLLTREREADEEVESWIRCVRVEYVAGDLTIEQFEAEVERFLVLGELWRGGGDPLRIDGSRLLGPIDPGEPETY